MTAMETWAQYQSVLQLAAGTNIAITGLLTVYGSEFGGEAQRVAGLIASSKRFREKIGRDHPAEAGFLAEIDKVANEFHRLERSAAREKDNSQKLVIVATVVCLIAAIASLVLLVISSFRPEVPSSRGLAAAIVLTAPPFIAIAFAAIRYIFVTRTLYFRRRQIESDMFVAGKAWLLHR